LLLRDLRTQFKNTIPVSEGFFKLMQETFGFYTELCNDFFSNLGNHIEENTLGDFLQDKIRPRLFDTEYCKTIESTKKQFLAENIKLEQFIEKNNFQEDFINDLFALKKVSDTIYELLQTHWEFFKYEKSVANNEVIVAFIREIDFIGIRWDSYLEKYLAISSILKAVDGEVEQEGYSTLLVEYHLPEGADFPIEMSTNLILFIQLAFDFVVKVHNTPDVDSHLKVSTLKVDNPVSCILKVPNHYLKSFKKFLGYLSVDVLKRSTLLKFVMEVVRLEQGEEVPKNVITTFHKKIATQLNSLHEDGFLSVDQNAEEDSVNILTDLCNEMDRLKITYKDMLAHSTGRLSRNRKHNLADMTSSAIKSSDYRGVLIEPPVEDKEAETDSGDNTSKSTVTIDIKNKEHILHLTS